ncbi:lamin-B3-like isoform X1 [Erythrolamprus reginae]|uniref:lamin-B3-like isoform X1 n=1 Tax=Erythrolamprus reginae TaxID=121349 RepID=UPI00396C6DCA
MAAARFSTPDSGLASDSALSPEASPILWTPLREREVLRQLNGRLAAYIQRVRASEAAEAALRLRLGRCEEDSRHLGSLRSSYESELAKARQALDHRALQEAALQAAADSLRQDHQQLLARNARIENKLSSALVQVSELQAQVNRRGAELSTALQTQSGLEKELRDSNEQTTSLKELLKSSRNELQNEKLKTAELEIQVKSFQEQMAFQKSFYENELKDKKQVYESRIHQIVSGRQQQHEAKMKDSLQELRKEHDQQFQEYKDHVEQHFQAKVENVLLHAKSKNDFATSVQEELKKTKLKVDDLISQNAELQAGTKELQMKIKELQSAMDTERESSKRCLAEKNREVEEMQQRMQSQLDKYEQLLDMKLALDLEIYAYKMLLEGEEKRLKLSKFSGESGEAERRRDRSWTTVSHGHRLFVQGKKRKCTPAKKQAHRLTFKVVQRASSTGSISIEDIEMEGKFIKIKNNSDQDQLLGGWIVRKQHRNETDTMYEFPAQFLLQAGHVVIIWEKNLGLNPSPSNLVWESQNSHGLGENTSIVLLNHDGIEMAEGLITCPERGESDGEVEDVDKETTDKIAGDSFAANS